MHPDRASSTDSPSWQRISAADALGERDGVTLVGALVAEPGPLGWRPWTSAGRSARHASGTWSGDSYPRARSSGVTGANLGAAISRSWQPSPDGGEDRLQVGALGERRSGGRAGARCGRTRRAAGRRRGPPVRPRPSKSSAVTRLEHDAWTSVPPGSTQRHGEPGQAAVGVQRGGHLRLARGERRRIDDDDVEAPAAPGEVGHHGEGVAGEHVVTARPHERRAGGCGPCCGAPRPAPAGSGRR